MTRRVKVHRASFLGKERNFDDAHVIQDPGMHKGSVSAKRLGLVTSEQLVWMDGLLLWIVLR